MSQDATTTVETPAAAAVDAAALWAGIDALQAAYLALQVEAGGFDAATRELRKPLTDAVAYFDKARGVERAAVLAAKRSAFVAWQQATLAAPVARPEPEPTIDDAAPTAAADETVPAPAPEAVADAVAKLGGIEIVEAPGHPADAAALGQSDEVAPK